MLILPAKLLDQAEAHARRVYPHEACGLMPGPAGSDTPTRVVEIDNVADNPEHQFRFDPTLQLIEWTSMDVLGEDPIVIYHSHTDTPAKPSRDDTLSARNYPYAHHLIISLQAGVDAPATVRSYGLVAHGALLPESIRRTA